MPGTLAIPPLPPATDHCWLPRSKRSPGLARRHLRLFLRRLAGGERFADEGQLVLSELVTNALTYGTPHDRLILVRFESAEKWLRLEVHDASTAAPAQCSASADDECGRGLELVNCIAQEWGYGPRDGSGKVVWALIASGAGDR